MYMFYAKVKFLYEPIYKNELPTVKTEFIFLPANTFNEAMDKITHWYSDEALIEINELSAAEDDMLIIPESENEMAYKLKKEILEI